MRRDAILGCLLGGAIGDAAGSSCEGLAHVAPGEWRHAKWRLTDDTQLTLATCEALVEVGVEPAAIADSMLRWFRERRLVGLGASTLRALRGLEAGGHWALVGAEGERSAGNGAAMRVAPLAFCVDPLDQEGRGLIRDVCRITHRNDEAYLGALAVVMALRGATLEEILEHLPDSLVRDGLAGYVRLSPRPSPLEAGTRFGVSGFVAESVPFALFAAASIGDLDFTEMLNQVLAAGGDPDTNASIAGQVAGAALGLAGLPADLLARVPEIEFILATGSRFADFVEAQGGLG